MQSLSHAVLAVVLFLVLIGVRELNGAPVSSTPEKWNNCMRSTFRLNQLAQQLAKEVLGDSRHVRSNLTDSVVVVKASDMCDPAGLKSDSKICLKKIAAALGNYSRVFGENGFFKGSKLKMPQQVQSVVLELLDLLGVEVPQGSAEEELFLSQREGWMREDLQRYSAERLLSFSIVVARVFAIGNPENHDHAPPAHCAQG